MTILALIVLLLCLAYYITVGLFRIGFKRHTLASSSIPNTADKLAVSVIIAMRNEEELIAMCIHSVLKSKSSGPIEIIVVNDHSQDRSVDIVSELASSHPSLQLLESSGAGKKAALKVGIESAKHPIIFLTDADCILGENTITSMLSEFDEEVDMVTGPVLFSNSESIFVKMQNLDILGLVAIGAGSLKMGLASMCNGANLAFKKDSFEAIGGYQGNEHISSGDDLFLMHKFYEKSASSVRFCSKLDAIVYSKAETQLKPFIAQRRRWASKGRSYDSFKLRQLGVLVLLVNLGILILTASMFWRVDLVYFLLGSLLLKLLADFRLLHAVCKHFKKKELLRYFLPEQVLHIPYTVFIGITGQFGKIDWKEREVAR